MVLSDSDTALRFSDVEVDAGREAVYRGGEEQRLRQKSFQVLLHLVRNRDRVVTREELFSEVWNGVAVTEDALVQCIVEIRKALGDNPRQPRFVRTIPKRGYRFIAEALGEEATRDSTYTVQFETTQSLEYEVIDETEIVDSPSRYKAARRAVVVLAIAGAVSLAAAALWSPAGDVRDVAGVPRTAPPSFADGLTSNQEAYRLYALGLERANQLRTIEAIPLFQRALAIDPEFAMAHARIGYTLAVIDAQGPAATPHLQRASQLPHRLSEKNRLLVSGWQAIANAQWEDAIDRFRLIVERYPTDLEGHLRLARLLAGEEQLAEAAIILERALLIDPRSSEVLNLLGGTYTLLAKHEQAIAARKRYVALRPEEPNAWDSLGLSYFWSGRYEEALEQYGRALEIQPAFDMANYHRAAVYVQLGRFQDALADARTCLTRASAPRDRSRVFAMISEIHRLAGDDRRAIEAARQIPERTGYIPMAQATLALEGASSEDPIAYSGRGSRGDRRVVFHRRGLVALRQGQSEIALEYFRDALRFKPLVWHFDSFETGLGDAYLALGRYAEARTEYSRVLSINPRYARALYGLGLAEEALGNHVAAGHAYRRFLDVWKNADPQTPALIDARSRIARLRMAPAGSSW